MAEINLEGVAEGTWVLGVPLQPPGQFNCPRCTNLHRADEMQWSLLDPRRWDTESYWTMCPRAGQPIIVRIATPQYS